jgi:hypothetical protein
MNLRVPGGFGLPGDLLKASFSKPRGCAGFAYLKEVRENLAYKIILPRYFYLNLTAKFYQHAFTQNEYVSFLYCPTAP